MTRTAARRVLITGATGVLGSELLNQLIEEESTCLVLLVRTKRGKSALTRTKEVLSYLGYSTERQLLLLGSGKIEIVDADMRQQRFNLSEGDYLRLAGSLTHIIHCASPIKLSMSEREAAETIVEPAYNILDLIRRAHRAHLEKVEYVSSVGVAGRDIGVLREEFVHRARAFRNYYEQAKAQTEQLFEQAVRDRLPITIHRPSMIVGNSVSGRIRQYHIFYNLLSLTAGRLTRYAIPHFGRFRLDIVPVDFVARVIVESMRRAEWSGRILHECTGADKSLTLEELFQAGFEGGEFGSAGYRLRVPQLLYRAGLACARPLLSQPARQRLEFLDHVFAYTRQRQQFDNSMTQTCLAAIGLCIPDPREYVRNVVRSYEDKKEAISS